MPTLNEDQTFTQIVQFQTEPAKQGSLIAAIVGEVERWIQHRPGFVSSTFHASLDGKHVVNYAQWRTEDEFHGFTADPETKRLGDVIRSVGPVDGPRAIACRVVRAIDA